jgi:hypothetical protein
MGVMTSERVPHHPFVVGDLLFEQERVAPVEPGADERTHRSDIKGSG